MNATHRFLVILLLSAPFHLLSAQRVRDILYDPLPPTGMECIALGSPVAGHMRLDVLLGIDESFCVFTSSAGPAASLNALVDISIEVSDSSGVVVDRQLFSDTFTRSPGAATSTPPNMHSLFRSFDLPDRKYSVAVDVTDHESSRKVSWKKSAGPIRTGNIVALAGGLFCRTVGNDTISLALGGHAEFGKKCLLLGEVIGDPHGEVTRLACSIERAGDDITGAVPYWIDTLSQPIGPGYWTLSRQNDRLRSAGAPDVSGHIRQFAFAIPVDTFSYGAYIARITATVNGKTATLKKEFRTVWVDLPLSLSSRRLALKALEFIATPEEVKELDGLPEKRLIPAFEQYWKMRDPTPATVFNEAMAEYYRRADVAHQQFQSVGHPSGLETERGKAYVLYGAPSAVERRLPADGAPAEIWMYTHLRKRLLFEDTHRNGDYRLTATEDM